MRIVLIALIIIFSQSQLTFEGNVTTVLDGDTIEVLHGGKAVRIRLAGIDCPEKAQAFGQAAKKFTSENLIGKTVKVVGKETDRYGRLVAEVWMAGEWLNKSIVAPGLAWHYKKYSDSEDIAEAEKNAQRSSKGLWADANPVAPWDWRKMK